MKTSSPAWSVGFAAPLVIPLVLSRPGRDLLVIVHLLHPTSGRILRGTCSSVALLLSIFRRVERCQLICRCRPRCSDAAAILLLWQGLVKLLMPGRVVGFRSDIHRVHAGRRCDTSSLCFVVVSAVCVKFWCPCLSFPLFLDSCFDLCRLLCCHGYCPLPVRCCFFPSAVFVLQVLPGMNLLRSGVDCDRSAAQWI